MGSSAVTPAQPTHRGVASSSLRIDRYVRRVRARLSVRRLAVVTLAAALGLLGFVAVWLSLGGPVSGRGLPPGLWVALGCAGLLAMGVVAALVSRFRRDPGVVVHRLAQRDPADADG